jgi:NADPH-dependent curcumin reductase CurA
MSQMNNRVYRLRHRPTGAVADDDLELLQEPIPSIGPGQALIHTLWLSLDPANRIWMSEIHYNMPPVPIGGIMRGFGIGQVVESLRDDMKAGDLVSGITGWADYAVADATNLLPFSVLPSPLPGSPTLLLGPLGHTGVTAYLGVQDIGRPQPGETMVVSAAAGAVGSVAGQIGKARGARVVGTAGSREKCRHVVEALGFDACVNYRDADWREQLDAATPDGIDVDFENVGGRILDHVVTRLNVGARIALCGLISDYNNYGSSEGQQQGRVSIEEIYMRRALLRSFLVLDHTERFPEAIAYLADLIDEGRLKYDETVVEGLENAPGVLNQMFEGANTGKLLIKVAEPQ